jgi:Domain of unknown function (DUF4783)
MKTLFLIFSLITPFSLTTDTDNLSVIQKALGEGDANTLGYYLDATVELKLVDKQDILDKTKATEALKSFFAKNKPRTFNPVHQGSSKGSSSHYTIGDLQTANGNFRVYIYYKSASGNFAIQEIRIEK